MAELAVSRRDPKKAEKPSQIEAVALTHTQQPRSCLCAVPTGPADAHKEARPPALPGVGLSLGAGTPCVTVTRELSSAATPKPVSTATVRPGSPGTVHDRGHMGSCVRPGPPAASQRCKSGPGRHRHFSQRHRMAGGRSETLTPSGSLKHRNCVFCAINGLNLQVFSLDFRSVSGL